MKKRNLNWLNENRWKVTAANERGVVVSVTLLVQSDWLIETERSDWLLGIGSAWLPTNQIAPKVSKLQGITTLRSVGIARTSMSPQLKMHLYRVYCRTLLTSGIEIGEVSKGDVQRLRTIEGKIVKHLLGLGKKSKTTQLLNAVGFESISNLVTKQRAGFYQRAVANSTTWSWWAMREKPNQAGRTSRLQWQPNLKPF